MTAASLALLFVDTDNPDCVLVNAEGDAPPIERLRFEAFKFAYVACLIRNATPEACPYEFLFSTN